MDRKISIISPSLGALLVNQVSHELNNHSLYMSFAAYFGREGLDSLEKYYRHRAKEEYNHHMWVVDYLIDGDFDFEYPAVAAVTQKPKDYLTPFSDTVIREIETTQLLYKIYELAGTEKDYMMCSWLYEKLIKEQIEEENISRMAESIAQQDSTDWMIKGEAVYELVEA